MEEWEGVRAEGKVGGRKRGRVGGCWKSGGRKEGNNTQQGGRVSRRESGRLGVRVGGIKR